MLLGIRLSNNFRWPVSLMALGSLDSANEALGSSTVEGSASSITSQDRSSRKHFSIVAAEDQSAIDMPPFLCCLEVPMPVTVMSIIHLGAPRRILATEENPHRQALLAEGVADISGREICRVLLF
jgi:hypothetical protein